MVDTSYADLSEIRLHIINITDSSQDDLLVDFKESVDREIDNWMSPYLDAIPTTPVTEDLIEAGNSEVGSRWFMFQKKFKDADMWHKKYLEIKEAVIVRLKATPTTVSKITNVTKAYLSSPLKDE